MSLENLAMTKTDDFPIDHAGAVHNGKVRSVYWLDKKDSKRLGEQYGVENSQLGVMIISDRISAFECIWESEGGLKGIPGKGAALNAISKYWFDRFKKLELAGNHILDVPHPLVWIVQKAKPIMIEAIARQYITGSMWRAYEKGSRKFCGITLPDGLEKNQKLNELLITPSTKGIMKGISGIAEKDDVNITKKQIIDNYLAFGFKSIADVNKYEALLSDGFKLISNELDTIGKIFVDTKFEFGYVKDNKGNNSMIYIDEVGTPDSSRYWSKKLYEMGETKEESKEFFREKLLNKVPDKDVLLNKNRMNERIQLSKDYKVSDDDMMEVSNLYKDLAQRITGRRIPDMKHGRDEVISALIPYKIIK